MMKNTDSSSTIGPLNQTKKCDFCVAEQQNKQRLETTVCVCVTLLTSVIGSHPRWAKNTESCVHLAAHQRLRLSGL